MIADPRTVKADTDASVVFIIDSTRHWKMKLLKKYQGHDGHVAKKMTSATRYEQNHRMRNIEIFT